MTRNEFKQDPLEGYSDLQIQDLLREGKITVNDVRRHRGLPTVGEDRPPVEEDQGQEVEPVEVDPHQWPSTALADLRREPGFSTTRSHIAERYSNEDAHLE